MATEELSMLPATTYYHREGCHSSDAFFSFLFYHVHEEIAVYIYIYIRLSVSRYLFAF